MDSLTQIVLGAACGEAILGKKIGNKALLFGAIGGTIPDLDVFVGSLLYGNEIDSMLFHRGFMHSILFSILGAFLFGWLVHKLYDNGKRKATTTRKDWIYLFFWALFTHPILDAFTGYGTQLFAPFSNYRIAFNNISVLDVFYTLPFLVCVIAILFYNRTNKKRKIWLKRGIVISSIYMLFTVANKMYVTSVFETSLEADGIPYTRFQTQPSLVANFLWYGTAETNDAYYVAYFSNFDSQQRIVEWQKINKQHHIVSIKDADIKNLAWFSNGYYNIYEDEIKAKAETKKVFTYTDLRYPFLNPNDSKSSVFSFKIFKDGERWNMVPFEPPTENERMRLMEVFGPMFTRMKGI